MIKMDDKELRLIKESLWGKSKSQGGLNITELRKRLIIFLRNSGENISQEEVKSISRMSREELKRRYLRYFDDSFDDEFDQLGGLRNHKFRILVLCANDETIEEGKSLDKIKEFLKIFQDEDGDLIYEEDDIENRFRYDLYYVNAIESEIEENLDNENTVLADIGELNPDVFPNNFFDFIIDEYCPINAPQVLSRNTFKWFSRILAKGGYLLLDDFTDIYKENSITFYNELKTVFNGVKTKDELIEHVKDYYDQYYDEEYSKELEEQHFDDLDSMIREYLDKIIKIYYEDVLIEETRYFIVNKRKIKTMDELKRLTNNKFRLIYPETVGEIQYIVFRK
jgi:hypothetical protein